MNIGSRLETIGRLVMQHAPKAETVVVADIGTDHAYLPVWLLERGAIDSALACDIAAGPCAAARTTVAMHNLADKVQVRQGSGLSVVQPGEANVVTIAGMGGSTISSILEADMETAMAADVLVLQPMAGAASLRQWLVEHGWQLVDEELVDDAPHFYEILVARRAAGAEQNTYTAAQYAVGPVLLAKRHALLGKQLERQLAQCRELLANMGRSERAKASEKYKETQELLSGLEALSHEYGYTC